ncbi:unnamed protein product [Closterium sp. Naga37s-1]|nr:unnamed protein product [Closterium sp. Naga37s-1]
MTRHLADSDDLAEWAELAEAVLADPVYRDRLEWFEYERRLHRDGAAAAVQYARDAGWVDMTDTFAWSGVDMEMLGTSFTKPIPRTHTSGTAAPAAPAVFPYSSGPAVSGVPSVRKRTARARQGRAGLGWPSGVNLAAVRAQQEQLARRQERRKRQSERRQQQTEGGNAGDSEEGGIEEADEGYMNLEKVSSDWLLDMVQKQQASIEEKRTKAGRQDEVGSEGSQAGKEPSARSRSTQSDAWFWAPDRHRGRAKGGGHAGGGSRQGGGGGGMEAGGGVRSASKKSPYVVGGAERRRSGGRQRKKIEMLLIRYRRRRFLLLLALLTLVALFAWFGDDIMSRLEVRLRHAPSTLTPTPPPPCPIHTHAYPPSAMPHPHSRLPPLRHAPSTSRLPPLRHAPSTLTPTPPPPCPIHTHAYPPSAMPHPHSRLPPLRHAPSTLTPTPPPPCPIHTHAYPPSAMPHPHSRLPPLRHASLASLLPARPIPAVLSSDGTHRRLLLPRRSTSAVPPPLATAGVGSPGAQAPVQGEGEGGVAEGGESHTHGREAASLWPEPAPQGWVAHAGVRDTAVWPAPAEESNGFVVVRCNGGLNQQRSAICNAVVVARIMNATLVLPRLDTNEFWNDTSGFATVYDVDHFIATLAADVRIVKDLPPHITADKRAKLVRLRPPREAPVQWYESDALRVLRRRGGVYLTPFAHRLAEELGTGSVALELQRLRCRANFHALRFHPAVHALADSVMARMRARSTALGMQGRFIAVHLRFEKDMLAFAGCFNIFSEEQQVELKAYREANFAEKELEQSRRRRIGKCPLTPHEVGLTLRAMGFPNSTLLYLAGGAVYGGEAFMRPLQALFPNIVRRADVATAAEMEAVEGHGRALLGQAVDYIVCTKADVFLPSYDGPSNFANNVLGHRLYLGFLPSLRPDRRSLSRVLDEREAGGITEDVFGPAVKNVLRKIPSASPFPRRHGHMAFFADPWPECFCQNPSTNSNVEGSKIRAKDSCPRHVAEEIAHI